MNIQKTITCLLLLSWFIGNNLVAQDKYSLSNDDITIAFEKSNQDRLEITDLFNKNKRWITPDSRDTDFLWQVTLENDKSNTSVYSSQMVKLKEAKETKNDKEDLLTFEWEISLSKLTGKVYVDVSLNKRTSLSEWSIYLDLPDGWEVTNLLFPIINVDKEEGTKLYTSSGWGAEYNLDKISNLNLQLIYPSSRQTMQLVCMQDGSDLLYYATHDENANHKTFSARVGSSVELSTDITASNDWTKNNKFSVPWKVSIGLNDKGIEDAIANWYRPFAINTIWGTKTLLEKDIPEWLVSTDLWLHGGRAGKDEMDALTKTLEYFGNDTKYHWYYWSSHEFDVDYPDYFPPRTDYDKIVNKIHSAGSRVMPYTNGRLWDTTTVAYQKLAGANEIVLRKNLTPYVEVYASKAPNAVVCPTSTVWNDVVVDFASRLLDEKINSDGVYFDQIASARSLPCYNENHNHPVGGGDFWHFANREIFNNVRKVLKKDQIIATEQNAECFIDVFDTFLMGNRPMGAEWAPAPLFPLVYSDRAILYGFYLHNPNDMSFRLKNALTLLWGAQLNGGRSVLYASDSWQNNATFLREMKEFRSKQHDLFVGGRMIGEFTPEGDNPLLTVESWPTPSNAVRGAKWISVDGKEAILLTNFDTNSHEIVLPNGQKQLLKGGECYRYNL